MEREFRENAEEESEVRKWKNREKVGDNTEQKYKKLVKKLNEKIKWEHRMKSYERSGEKIDRKSQMLSNF